MPGNVPYLGSVGEPRLTWAVAAGGLGLRAGTKEESSPLSGPGQDPACVAWYLLDNSDTW